MQRLGKFATLIGAVLAQLLRYIYGNVANPAFREVKSNDANRVAGLSFQQILDNGVEIVSLTFVSRQAQPIRPKSSGTK